MFEVIGKKILLRAVFDAPDVPVGIVRPGILLIVRDPGARSLLELVLRRRGFAVWDASGAQEAFGLCRAVRRGLSLVLADADLPDIGVTELMIRLRLLEPSLRFCFMFDETSERTRTELDDLGAVWVFPRPFPVVEVVEILWRLARKERRKQA